MLRVGCSLASVALSPLWPSSLSLLLLSLLLTATSCVSSVFITLLVGCHFVVTLHLEDLGRQEGPNMKVAQLSRIPPILLCFVPCAGPCVQDVYAWVRSGSPLEYDRLPFIIWPFPLHTFCTVAAIWLCWQFCSDSSPPAHDMAYIH